MPTLPEIINDTKNKEYSVARLSKDNLNDLALLYKEVYNKVRPGNYFLKKYDTAYTGIEWVGFIAYDKQNEPAAYYGVIPCFIQSGKEILLAAQSADTMTHPMHRNKGLFIKLSKMTFDLCRQLGIRLIFGFPNQNSYPAMIKHLGWVETEKMSRFIVPVDKMWGWNFIKKIYGRKYEHALNKLSLHDAAIKSSVIEDGYAGVHRNEAYMNYKTYSDTYILNINSALLWLKPGNELTIGDIILKENNREYFFEDIKALAKKLNKTKISFQVSGGCNLYDLFAANYKPIPSFPVLFKDFGSGLQLNKIKFTFADIDIF